ncbi:MAG: DUF4832 domain-containing protein [Clostridia bacterium]|nr:DUF4832 domain-containing protein [Clostridia bacterium]
MKRNIALILSFILILCSVNCSVYADDMLEISLSENDAIISGNPGKGWVRYSTISSGLSDELLNLISTGYARFNWYEIEPKEGEYNWALIDSALESWSAVGKKFAFGIMSVNTATTEEYVTPKWVFTAGARYTRMSSNASSDGLTAASGQFIPVWDDEVYLEKVRNLASALASRYDGDERIAFIDIRSYGNYGETHLLRLESSGSKALDFEGEKKHIDAYADSFKKTKLIYPTANKSTHKAITEYAVNRGVGLRYDGIMQDSTNGILLKPAKDKNTAIFEFALPYSNLKATKSGNRSWNESAYIAAFNRALPSYMDLGQYNEDSELFYKDNKKLVTKMTNTMGYHFVIRKFALNREFAVGDNVRINCEIENKGVTKLFEPAFTALVLLDDNNNEVSRMWLDSIDANGFGANEVSACRDSVVFGDVPDGTYKLAFGMFLDKEDKYPAYKFGNFSINDSNYYQIATVNKAGKNFTAEDPYVHINGKTYAKEINNGKVYLPVRACFEGIGAKVGWSEETGAFVEFEGNTIYLRGDKAYLNDLSEPIGKAYVNQNGISYLEMDIFKRLADFNYRLDTKTGGYIINTAKYDLSLETQNNGIISDGSFEAYSDAWSFNYSDFEYSNNSSFSGKTALKVNNNQKGALAYQSFTALAGKEYNISFAVNDAASVGYVISDGNDAELYSGIVPKGQGEWQEYSFKFGYDYDALNGSKNITKIGFISEQDNAECAYIDNVSVSLIGDIDNTMNGLFADNGIETNRTKWQGRNGATFARTSENPHSGNLCGVLKERAGTWYGGMIDIYDSLEESGPGIYKFEGWFRTAPGDGEMGITLYSFKLNNAIDITQVFKIGEEWTYLSFESEITKEQYETIYSAYALIMGDPNDNEKSITKNIYFDDIKLTKVSD